MLKRLGLAMSGGLLMAAFLSGGVIAGNPAGTGQPGAECGEEGAEQAPPGFASGGFENAEEHYAGEGDASTTHANSDHAVSQYDVACYQYTQHH